MLFEWDESKNRINREKHGLEFGVAFDFDWDSALIVDRTREGENEQRYAAVGRYRGKTHTVVFTKRGSAIRIISLRRSNRTEEKAYASANTEI